MKRISTFLIALVFLITASAAHGATTIYMPYAYDSDKPRTAVVSETSTLTYDGYWAESGMYKPAFVYLEPANAGELIRITFTQYYGMDSGDPQLRVYDGHTDVSENWNYTLPAGDKGQVGEGAVFESTASDGTLTVAWYEGEDEYHKWSATVEVVSSADMEVLSTETVDLSSSQALVGGKAQPLAAINVKTQGSNNPLSLTGLSYTISSDADKFSNRKVVYNGRNADFNAAEAVDFSGSQQLVGGNNYFYVVGDVSAAAAVGNAVAVDFASVKVGDAEQLTSTLSSTTQKIGNTLLMPKSGTFTVGDAGYVFYDDGGKDGKISSKFDGAVTFVPADPTKRIAIDFSKVALYESSYGSDTYNDKLYVYNGQTVAAANLNRQVKNGETGVVRSAADDGSLTVALTTVNGEIYIGQGFEAAVSQFVAQAMTVKSVSVQQAATTTVSGGDKNQEILSVVIETENTDPALTASQFQFNATGTSANVVKAAVYYTGLKSEFATTNKVGEAAVSSDAFSVVADNPVTLVEGKNYFWLAYDVAVSAADGATVEGAVTSITLSDGEHAVESGSPEGDREVLNVVYATLGVQTKVVYGSTLFKDEHYTGYYDVYDPTVGDRTVTFVPATAGKIIELDFSAFDVAYSSSSYGVKAKFEIYDGKTATGTPVWKLDSSEKSTTGPEGVIRSKATDGSLTVVFNSVDGSSYYAGKGWTATAREYQSTLMEVKSIEVAQATIDFTSPGKTDQEILKVKVTTVGDRNPLAVNKLSLDLKGSQTDVSKVKVYSTGLSEAFATDLLVGSADVDGESATIDVEFPNPILLAEGAGIYWVAFDVKSEAVPGNLLDAKVVSVTIENAAQNVAQGDPEGGREIKNIYLMPTTGRETVNVGQYAYMFYDDGGADKNYSDTQNGTVTFVPTDAESAIQFKFNSFKNSYNDYLRIYSGTEVAAENLLGEYTMYSEPEIGSTLLSKSADGAITVKFDRQGYSNNEGWEIEVSSKKLVALSCGTVKATDVAENAQVLGGTTDKPVLKVAVEAVGDRGEFTVDELSFAVTNSASLSGLKVFYTGTSDLFDTTTLYGEGQQPGDALSFAGSQKIAEPGTYYFWLVASVKSDAEIGAESTFKQSGMKAGGRSVEITESDVATITVKDGFSGTYTIGATDADYATIASAIDAMKDGINGAVVFNIKNGSYKEELLIPEIPGASEVNTITFKSETGSYSDVTITSDGYTGGYNDDNPAVLTVYGADYITFEGITFTNPDDSYSYLVDVKNASNYVTLRNNYFKGKLYTDDPYQSDTHRLLHTNFVNNPVANTPDTYMTVEGNVFEGGYVGISIGGASLTDMNRGTRVIGNTFKSQWNQAIISAYDSDGEISGNVITSSSTQQSKEYVAIDVNNSRSITISGNTIRTTVPYVSGIKLRPATGTAEMPMHIFNNVVNMSGLTSASSAYGISITNGSNTNKLSNIDIAYNTIRLAGDNTTKSAGIYNISNFTESVAIQNNIIQNEAGGFVYWINSKPVKATTPNNNSLYTSGSTFAKNYTAFENWQTASGETDSKVQQVEFLSDEVLSPKTAEGLTFAKVLDYVATDVAGNERDAQNPTVGAYEFVVEKAPEMEAGYPKLSGTPGLDKADVAVKTTANATVSYLVSTAAEAPTKEEVVASETKVETAKGQETLIALKGLNPSTEYYMFFVLQSMTSDLSSDVISMAAFTTQEPEPDPLTVSLDSEELIINSGEKATLTATVVGGVAPYTYSWTDARMNEVASSATFESTPSVSGDYVLTVTDARSETAMAKARVIVRGDAVVATFDDLYLDDESYWMGDATSEDGMNSFVSGSYAFSNYYMPDYMKWAYFGYSNLPKTTFDELMTDQFASAVGHGVDNSRNYAVVYAGEGFGPTTVTVLNDENGDIVKGCYVTNSAWVAYVKDHGTGMESDDAGASEPFKTGDYFKITATGDNGKTAEMYLADYRTDDVREFVDDWKWFDLSTLGTVKTITFTVDGSRKNAWGSTIPSYFCMDNFNGTYDDGSVGALNGGNGQIYSDGTTLRFKQYNGYKFRLYTTAGQLVGMIDVDSDDYAATANYNDGVYVIVGTDGTNSVSEKIVIK